VHRANALRGERPLASSGQRSPQPVIDIDDQERWRNFVDIYNPLIYRYARLKGLGHEDASEVVQECMTSLVQSGPDVDYEQEPHRFKAWLRRVATNRINDMFKKRRPTHALPEDFDLKETHEPSVDAVWEEQWKRKHVRTFLKRILARVSESTRHAFQLYVVSGWPVDEVAETLNISTDQVYAARSRITRELRRMAHEILGDRTEPES